ncbi:glycoside hydrolase family 113 [Maribacter algicola]|uniref:Glycoside hydrolase family 113 n=1 Tax=Meishania litoralis TaxID=3434685 RepID=A0ACC7LNE4_9FLAO
MKKIALLILCILQFSCSGQGVGKINGVSFVASREEVAQGHIDEVVKVNANHAAIMPFGFIRDVDSPNIVFDTDRQWFGETKRGALQYIEMLHKNGIKVMLKPHIWISHGEFTGTMAMKSEESWQALEASYEKFILNYAQTAQEADADIFCIGTELEQFVKNRPGYWKRLIRKIREIYKGKLTYAANWDEYARTPFWEDLDYIGIDAYFPLSEEITPSIGQLKLGWKPWKEKIAALSDEKNRPVLFTEYGYRSMDYTAKKPWLVDLHDEKVNLVAQANALTAIFEEFWKEDWFAGGYVWKWFIRHKEVGGDQNNRFTPQNKPAQEVLSRYYRSE